MASGYFSPENCNPSLVEAWLRLSPRTKARGGGGSSYPRKKPPSELQSTESNFQSFADARNMKTVFNY